MAEKFTLGKVFSAKGWYQFIGLHARYVLIAIIVLAGLYVWQLFAPKKQIQNNTPTLNAAKDSKATQVNNYIQNKEAGAWEVGGHAGVIRLGDQDGGYVGGEIKRRF